MIVGPRMTSTPLRRASTAATLPYRRAMPGSQDEPSAVADGRFSEGLRSSQVSPRTPDGPSDTRIRRSPILSSGQVAQKSCPVSTSTFSSSVSSARSAANLGSRRLRRLPAGVGRWTVVVMVVTFWVGTGRCWWSQRPESASERSDCRRHRPAGVDRAAAARAACCGDEIGVPAGAVLGDAVLRPVVDVDQAEPFGVPLGPFEVVQERPGSSRGRPRRPRRPAPTARCSRRDRRSAPGRAPGHRVSRSRGSWHRSR